MTDVTSPAEGTDTTSDAPPTAAPVEPQETAPAPEAGNVDPALQKARKEAAAYRERLRAAESERDTATSTIDALRQQLVASSLTDQSIKPEALWSAGYKPGDLIADDGTVDAGKLAAAVTDTRARFGINRFQGGADAGIRDTSTTSKTPTWGDMLKY